MVVKNNYGEFVFVFQQNKRGGDRARFVASEKYLNTPRWPMPCSQKIFFSATAADTVLNYIRRHWSIFAPCFDTKTSQKNAIVH